MFDIHKHWKRIFPIKLINIFVTSHIYLCSFFVKTFKFYFLSKFHLHNSVITIIAKLYIGSSYLYTYR